MPIFKKLIFAPFFLIAFSLLIYQLNPLLQSYDIIFSLSTFTLIQLIIIAALISLSGFLFVLFATLAGDWRFSLPVGAVASAIPLIFMEKSLGLVFTVGILISVLLVSLTLDSALKSYLNFQPASLLGPFIRRLSMMLILAFCIIYFFSSNKLIVQNGFEIPDSLIDTALKMVPLPAEQTQLPNISPDQIAMLKKNPDLVRQSGLDPKILDSLDQPQNSANNLIKQTVKDQVQNFIKPYASFIPAILAVLLFLTLQSLTSFLNLLIYPLLWFAFLILEKTGFTKYETEMREVKKLVV
ncbi:hypothetical protein HYU94_04025 [Candidatus Daviesbacteria bacterium]|nr:hypothetical protein [Candidatus Daviesbacteria bacterium]